MGLKVKKLHRRNLSVVGIFILFFKYGNMSSGNSYNLMIK